MEDRTSINLLDDVKPLRFKDFFVNQKLFFSHPNLDKFIFRYLVIFIVGLASAADRIENKYAAIAYSDLPIDGLFAVIAMNWTNYWIALVILAIPGGYLIWLILGLWYNLRLKWSGVIGSNASTGKNIMMFNSLIKDIPILVIALVSTLMYSNYNEAFLAQGTIGVALTLFVLLATALSVINSYRSVTAFYEVNGLKPLLWFLLLPMAYLVCMPLMMITAVTL